MKDLLFFVIAEGRYKSYREMWELALSMAYPEYGTQVLQIDRPVDYPQYYGACVRFLCDLSIFHEYRYVYIGDIDMMIVREPVPVLEYHRKELIETGLCYSNTQRGREVLGNARLTGLHFVSEPWWSATAEARQKWNNKLINGNVGHSPIDDELMLMQIVKDSGLELPPLRKDLIGRHHGLHLGTVRAHEKESRQSLKSAVGIRVKRDKAILWQDVVATKDYARIMGKLAKSDKQAYNEFYLMDQFTKCIAKG